MLAAGGRIFVRFEAYRTNQGRGGWKRFTVTDSFGHEFIRTASDSEPESSLLSLALDSLFETISEMPSTSHEGLRLLESQTRKRDR
jgi:hypothetical protein